MAALLDHLVYGVTDLRAGVEQFHALTGARPVAGGRHEQHGTANYLLGLGTGAYLEIIGPDPDAGRPPGLFGLDRLREPRLLTWAVRPPDLDACVAASRAAGYDPGEPASMSRRTGDGALLAWRLTADTVAETGGVVPFLIDWTGSPLPSDSGLPQVGLHAFTVHTPDPERSQHQLAALGVTDVPVESAATAGLSCMLDCPTGRISLR